MITDKKYDKDKKTKREQSGMALIMALGILSMLVVLTLAFASSARTSSKMAKYNADTTKARLLAEGVIERVVALANLYNADVAATVNPPKGAPIDYRYGESDDNDFLKITDDKDVKWTYVHAKENYYDDAGNPQERDVIIGRYAYMIVGNPTFLDPAACVEQGNGARSEAGPTKDRLGIYLNEINLGNLGAPMNGTVLIKMSSSKAAGQLTDTATTNAPLPGDARWGDLDTMCTKVGIPINTTPGSDYDKCSNWFQFPTVKDKEAFSLNDPTTLYKRFNIRRFTADSDGDGINDSGNWWDDPDNDGTSGATGSDGGDHVAYILDNSKLQLTTAASGIDTLCIPYLSNLYSDGDANSVEHGTFDKCDTLAEQITANLIDYCDTDDVPTSDVNPSSWDTSTPTYTGNEKTPYLNEFSLGIEATMTIVKSDSNGDGVDDKMQFFYTVNCVAGAEVINMYKDDMTNVTVDSKTLTLQLIMKNPDGSYQYCGVSPSPAFPLSFGTVPAQSYKYVEDTFKSGTYYSPKSNISDTLPSIGYKYSNLKVIVSSNSQNVDYSSIGIDWNEFPDMATATASGDVKSAWLSFQIDDPRQNLNDQDWPKPKVVDQGDGYPSSPYGCGSGGTPGTVNNFTLWDELTTCANDSSSDYDYEVATDPVNLSTAYIRNDTMQSPWELGAIHRGLKWQTINLCKAHSGTKMLNYDQGDGNLLDQIKMFSEDEVYGKFNLNCGDVNADNYQAQQEALAALFEGIHLGADYDDPAGTGTEISHGDAMSYANDLIVDTSSNGGHGGWSRRSQVANAECLQSGDTDAEKEELIGKFINLSKAGTPGLQIGTKASIMVIAQTIKDVGGNGTNLTLYKDLNLDGEIANFTDVDDVDEDGDTTETISETKNTQLGIYDLMFDEITSQTILTGKVELDSGVWKLKRYLYPE